MALYPIKILLAEDNPDHAELTIDVLKDNKVLNDIDLVIDGEKAIEYMENSKEGSLPDLILLDIKMPKKSGIDVLRYIKEHNEYKHIPTVMLSTSEDMKDVNLSYSIGANCFISKPVDFIKFTTVIESLNYYWTLTAKLPDKLDV